MKKTIFLSCALLFSLGAMIFLPSCGTDQPGENSSSAKDSPAVVNNSLGKTVGLFKEGKLPLLIDTTLLFQLEKYDSLGTFEIKTLAEKWFKHDLNDGTEYGLATFYMVDSIKAAGKYKQYCDSLNIGMTKITSAHAISEVQLDPNTLLLIWGLYASSYEACPYSTSYSVYFTVVYKGNVEESCLLGEYISAGDPPVSMERIVTGKLQADGTFTIDVVQMNDEDMDLPEVEMVRENYSFVIKDGAIKIVAGKKEPPQKVKRKKR